MFHGSIREIEVYYPEAFNGRKLGAALAQFPDLRRVVVFDNEPPGPAESDWKDLAAVLRSFPNLEEIELGGAQFTDGALEALAGHPNLRSVAITGGRMTAGCAKTLVTLPRLATLRIENQQYEGDAWLSAEEEREMLKALPGVAIEIP